VIEPRYVVSFNEDEDIDKRTSALPSVLVEIPFIGIPFTIDWGC
jgi:hypothetical protein